MHLMYYTGSDGKRVYTLKVCWSLSGGALFFFMKR